MSKPENIGRGSSENSALNEYRIKSMVGIVSNLHIMSHLLKYNDPNLHKEMDLGAEMRKSAKEVQPKATPAEIEEAVWQTSAIAVDKHQARQELG